MKKFTILSLLIVLALNIIAQETIPFSTDFNLESDFNSWTIENTNDDGDNTWMYSPDYFGVDGSGSPVCIGSSAANTDDWLFSPGLTLEAGVQYTLSFEYTSSGISFSQNLAAFIGTENNSTAMTSELITLEGISNDAYELATIDFTVNTTGTYHIGMHDFSYAGQLGGFFDNFSVEGEGGTTNNKELISNNINVYPNPTSNYINITDADNSEIFIYNVLGKVVYSGTIDETSKKVDLSSFENGTYIVKVISNKETISKKVYLVK